VIAGHPGGEKAGFDPVKVNAVSIRGFTESEVVPLARRARAWLRDAPFIECMPIGADPVERNKGLLRHEILEQIERRWRRSCRWRTTIRGPRPWSSATRRRAAASIIAPSRDPSVCAAIGFGSPPRASCATASLLDEVDVKSLLRTSAPPEEMPKFIRKNRLGQVGGP